MQISADYNLFIVIFFLLYERYYQFLQLCFTQFSFHSFIHLVYQRSFRVDILIELIDGCQISLFLEDEDKTITFHLSGHLNNESCFMGHGHSTNTISHTGVSQVEGLPTLVYHQHWD